MDHRGFEQSEPVRVVLSQVEQLKKRYGSHRVPSQEFNPHYRAMSSLQNLGSVINTAFSVLGQHFSCTTSPSPIWSTNSTPTSCS